MNNLDNFYQKLLTDFYGENSSKEINELYADINKLKFKLEKESDKVRTLEQMIKSMQALNGFNDRQQEDQLKQMEFKTNQLIHINQLNEKLKYEKNELLKQLSAKTTELDLTNINLQQANIDLDQFTAMASHDLKSPLRGISHLTEWVVEDEGNTFTKDSKKNLDLIGLRSKRLTSLIDSLLDYSRVGRKDYEPIEIDLNTDLHESFSLLDNPNSAKLNAAGLPTVQAPASVIQSIFANLFSNSIKYSNVKNCQITVTSTTVYEFIYFSIHDNGKGIDNKLFEKIFEPFVSLQSKDEIEGSGLGLAHSRKLSRHFGGDLYLDSSSPEAGTTFIFKWPTTSKQNA